MANPSGPPAAFDGVTSYGVPLLGGAGMPYPIPMSTNVFFVSSVMGGNGFTGGMTDPFATLAFALANKATARGANNPSGTVIVCLPGHAEVVSSATGLPCSVAGVTVVGLGFGNQRPKFTLDTANTATIAVSADGVSFVNCRFIANFLSIAACFTLTTAKSFTLIGNEFRDTSGVLNFLNVVKSTGAGNTIDGLNCVGNYWYGLGTTSVNSFILSANDIDAAVWQFNTIVLARTATAAILATISAGVLTNLDARWNVAISKQVADTGGAFINVGGTTSSGVVANNYLGDLSTTDLFMTTSVALTFFENKKTGVVSASGYLLPAADS